MAELFYMLPRNAKNMTAQELRAIFNSDTDKSYLMRSIIMSERYYPGVDYTRSLRSLWYSVVKPTLDKLGLLTNADQTEEALTKWDATLSRYVADLLRRGYLTYSDLHILDNSRSRSNPRPTYYTTNNKIYGYKATIAPYSNIIVATEKDTVYNIIRDIAQLFGCSCISCKGQNSLGAMEDLVRGMKLADSYDEDMEGLYPISGSEYMDWVDYIEENEWLLKFSAEDLDEVEADIVDLVKKYQDNVADFLRDNDIIEVDYDKYYKEKDGSSGANTVNILTMTDYDPAGYYIAEALESQVKDILAALGKAHIGVTITRVGITPDQLDDGLVEANKYSPKPANLDKWVDRTGGIDGEPYGLELDALEPSQIREIFVGHLLKYVDEDVYKGFIKESYTRRVALEAMASRVEEILTGLVKEYDNVITLKNMDIRNLAIKGYDSFPTHDICTNSRAVETSIASDIKIYFNLRGTGESE